VYAKAGCDAATLLPRQNLEWLLKESLKDADLGFVVMFQ
jgi:hypothetical protein